MNLNKLESKLDDALSKETTESLTNWLNNKRMEKKQTAVEWFFEQLLLHPLPKSKDELLKGDWSDIFEQAKQLNKEQMQFMFDCGRNFQLTGEGTFKQVYEETYK